MAIAADVPEDEAGLLYQARALRVTMARNERAMEARQRAVEGHLARIAEVLPLLAAAAAEFAALSLRLGGPPDD